MPLTLNYTGSPGEPQAGSAVRASLVLLAVFVFAAVIEAAFVAFGSQGLAIAAVQLFTPALNLLLGVVAVGSLPIALRYLPRTTVWLYVSVAIVSPFVATFFVFVVGTVAGVKLVVC